MRKYDNPNIGHNEIITATAEFDMSGTRLLAFALAALVERLEAVVEVMDEFYLDFRAAQTRDRS